MSTDKKFFWIKLKTDFFNKAEIDFLLSQKNGCEYIILYEMLCLYTANNEGKLMEKMNEIMIPYTIDKIVRDTKYFDFDTVVLALDLYKKLGLVYLDENNILNIKDYESMVGGETKWANQKRLYREKQKEMIGQCSGQKEDNVLKNEDNVSKCIDFEGQLEDNVRQEIDIEIENRDRDRYRDRNNINNISKNGTKNFYKNGISPYWMEHPEVCELIPTTDKEKEELNELLKEFK